MNFDKFEKILEASSNIIKKIPIKEKTFMDISGYPHYENVCSNILAFYLDPKDHVDAKLSPNGWRIGIFTWTAVNSNRVKQIIVNSNYNIIEDEANHRWLYQFNYKTQIEEILDKVIEVYNYMEKAFKMEI